MLDLESAIVETRTIDGPRRPYTAAGPLAESFVRAAEISPGQFQIAIMDRPRGREPRERIILDPAPVSEDCVEDRVELYTKTLPPFPGLQFQK